MDGPRQGPVMLDLTDLVRRPAAGFAFGGFFFEVRKVVAVVVGMLLFAPLAWPLFVFTEGGLGLLTLMLGAGAGLMLLFARPDGQSLHGYAWRAMTGRIGTVDLDGERRPVYVGVARVREFHNGQQVRIGRAAVEVRAGLIDDSGAMIREGADRRPGKR